MDKEITCIVCPIGCKIKVEINNDKIDIKQGNKCKRGIDYAYSEALDPRRVLTTSVLVEGGQWPLVSVKTTKPVPKNKIEKVLSEIKKMKVKAPIKSGQILIKNVASLDIDVVSTKTIN